MDTTLVTEVLKEAIDGFGKSEIFNSDQGSQYTSKEHTDLLKSQGIRVSMNRKGRSIDNIAIERFFRTLKYDEIYITEYGNIRELQTGIEKYMEFYNFRRFHSALKYGKPMKIYQSGMKKAA